MKPLPARPITEEDLDAWWWGTKHHGRKFEVFAKFCCIYVKSDRCDAELMSWAQWARKGAYHWTCTHGWLECMNSTDSTWVKIGGPPQSRR